MACLGADCTRDYNHEKQFSNDPKEIAVCLECGALTRIEHDEYGYCPNPFEEAVSKYEH